VALEPFDRVVTEHGPTVLRVCRALLGPADADDAWSETFLSALRAYPDLRPGSNVRGWLVTIAHRKAIDQWRRAQRSPLPVGDPPEVAATDDVPLGPDDELRRALAALPFKQRHAVVYRYLADLSYDDVGALLGCSPVAARRNAADGIAALRATYAGRSPA
jgi:RNA polymerase sigma factor (sigma-70 family)